MATITEEAGKYIVITVCGLAVLAITAWFNTPTTDDFRILLEREAPWVRDKQAVLNEITSVKEHVAALMAKMDRLESTQDNIKSDINTEMRVIHLALQRVIGRLDSIDSGKRQERSDRKEPRENEKGEHHWDGGY